jgi:hypothetical protein
VVPYHPPGSSPIQIRGEIGIMVGQGVAVEDLEEIEQNLEGLTMNIPDITVDELPRCYQHHTVGVSTSIGRLLRRVARESFVIARNILDAYVYEAMSFTILTFWSQDKHFFVTFDVLI